MPLFAADSTVDSGSSLRRSLRLALGLSLGISLALVSILSGCGGGGGGSGTAVSPVAGSGSTSGSTSGSSTGTNTGGSSTGSTGSSSNGAGSVAFRGTVLLASPTTDSVKVNLYSPDQSGVVWVVFGTSPDVLMRQTVKTPLKAGTPVELALTGLNPGERHYYGVRYAPDDTTSPDIGATQSFQTARAAGSSFTFAIQGDSHPERANSQFNADLYARTLDTAAADKPDFYVLMGDDFSVDTIDPSRITQALVTERYTLQRPYLTRIGRSAPLFLVNGNHEQAAGYLLDGTPNNVAVWAQTARNSHYSQPAPDAFYGGNPEIVPHIGLLRNYYAWQWGDALFVVIDPYWSSPVPVDNVFGGSSKVQNNMWQVTHGDAQYQWLKRTLESSKAKYKFVFAHHVMGTGRGGIELAGLWEWGGRNTRGAVEFPVQRPTWSQPIHQLFVANKVTIFFQGHDHIWVRQQLDGVTYQTLSEPADPNYALYFDDAYLSGDKFPNSGYTRVSVSPANVKVEYVRSYLPAHETPTQRHGTVAASYTLP